jgi:hypothetical protein
MTQFFELLFTGLLAGFELAVHYGIGAPPASLPETGQIVLRQTLVRRLRILAPSLFMPAFLLALLVAVQGRHAPGSGLRWATVGMLLVWIVIRIVRTVPVNSATLEWNPEAPPKDWRALVERTERFHVVASWAAVIAFLCSLTSTFRT